MSTQPRTSRKPATRDERPADPPAAAARASTGGAVPPEDETDFPAVEEQDDDGFDEDEDAADPFEGIGDRDVGGDFDPDARRGLNNFGRIMSEIDLMNPAERHQPSKAVLEGMRNSPIFAAAQVDGQESWLVEWQNPLTDLPEHMDKVAKDVTWASFIRRYIEAMPEPGAEEPSIFHLKPLDKAGRPLSTKAQVIRIPWQHPILLKIRERMPTTLNRSAMDANSLAIRLLEQQAENARKDRDAAMAIAAEERRRAAELAERAMQERLNAAASDAQSLGNMYSAVNTIQTQGFNTLLSTSEKMAAEREARESARIARELADREDARKRERDEREATLAALRAERADALKAQQEEARMERERIRADNDARLAAAKQEADAKLAAIKAETEQRERDRKAEAEAKEKEADRKLQLELKLIEERAAKAAADALRDAARIKAEADERAAAREAEFKEREAARKQEQEREDRRRAEEQARRDKLDMDRERMQLAAAAQIEKSRQDAATLQMRFMDQEDARRKEHLTTTLELLRERSGEADKKSDLFGMVGEFLGKIGLTPMEALEKGKEFLAGSGSAGLGATIVTALAEVTKEIVKRVPIVEEMGEEDDDDEEDVEERPIRRPRRIERKADEPVAQSIRNPEVVKRSTSAPGLSAFVNSLPDSGPSTIMTPIAESEISVTSPTTSDMTDLRAGREAMLELVDRLETTEDWEAAIMGLDAADALMIYVTRVGLIEACDGYDIDINKLGAALVALGLFSEPPMVGVRP